MSRIPLKTIIELVTTNRETLYRGNHGKQWRIAVNGDKVEIYTYHNNIVCVVNENKTDDCGYSRSPSTTVTLRSYDTLFGGPYTKVTKEQAQKEGWVI